jgi:hypothetical protein
MRSGSSTLLDGLKGSFDVQYVVDVFANGSRAIANAPVTNVQLHDDATSLVQGTGSFTIAYQGDFADSVAPIKIGDTFSPFGTEVTISAMISIGTGFQERVPMGTYLISETPQIVSQKWLFNGGVFTKGDLIDVSLKDRMYGIQRDRFYVPGSPPDLSSVWKEIQRLSGLPVTRTITDGTITSAVAYQEDKLQAVYDLATVLDATACMTADGTVSMRPNVWPAPVDILNGGDGGSLLSVGKAMANDNVYNAVVIRSSDGATGQTVLATAEVSSGPLRTSNPDGSLSPYRRVPYFYSSPFITTQAQAQAYANTLLPRVSQLRSAQVVLTEIFNPLRDLGDVITVNRYASAQLVESFSGRVVKIDRTDTAQQTTTVAVGP